MIIQNKPKFLFLIPPYLNETEFSNEHKHAVLPAFTIPYGVLSMITYLDFNLNSKWEFDVLDLNLVLQNCLDKKEQNFFGYYTEALSAKIHNQNVHIAGISALFNSSFDYVKKLAALVKKISPDVYVIVGGGVASAAYKEILTTCRYVDAVCKGEGELPLKNVLSDANYLDALEKDISFINRNKLDLGFIPESNFIVNLDEIPPLQFQRVNLKRYNSRSIDKNFANNVEKQEMSIHTSRGCPFKCVFCSNPSLHGYTVRFMSPERVRSDTLRMKKDFGMNVLLVEDDHFFANKNRAKKILKELADLKINVEFPNGMAVYAIDDEIAFLLKNAGVTAVALGVESGSEYVLKNLMKKPVKTKMIKPAVNSLRAVGIRVHAFIVVGIPGELDCHREETKKMLLDSGFDWVHIYCATPIYGSELFNICIEKGYISTDSKASSYINTKSLIRAEGVDPEKIMQWVYDTQLKINFCENYNLKNSYTDRARHYLENVVKKYPQHAVGHYYMGKLLMDIGDKVAAQKEINTAKRIFNVDHEWREIAFRLGGEIAEFIGKTQ